MQEFLLECCNRVYSQETIQRWKEGCLIPFPKKGDFTSPTNYMGITLTPIAAQIYNLILLNRIRPKIDQLLRKNQNSFRINRSTSSQILTIRRLFEGVKSLNLPAVLLFVNFSKAFDSIDRKNMKHTLKNYGISAETVKAMALLCIMMLYMNTRYMVRSPDGDTQFFEITTGVLQGDTIAPFLFIICLDYFLKSSIDCSSNCGFTLKKRRSRRHPAT